MEIVTSIAIQALLLGLAFGVTCMRCWIRVRLEQRGLTLVDWLVWGGWLCALGWFSCSTKALYILIHHPLDEETRSDSVDYLKTVFASVYFFDTGLYFPKASLVAFYWWLIPSGFRRLRIATYVAAGAVACAFLASILTDTLIAPKISDNWSIENQLYSTWNAYANLVVNWTLNFSTDLLLFILPFFIVNCLKLRKRQRIGLVGVFSLGAITMAISLARFIVYNMDYNVSDADGNLWCTAEMCTAIIVVSLPFFKTLIIRSSTPTTMSRSDTGYISGPSNRIHVSGDDTYSSHVQGGPSDDEVELTFQDRKRSLTPPRMVDEVRTQDGKDNVMVTTKWTVTRDML
ncbi:hypothetical protein COCC4DRAFT_65715 [Bipolaris maydis ATCC 48331]|uniref:Rhodopsin domain-containing protein n=2 Tax=Cochliobolus heterostrophus TaxID=5016 RepID=M2UBP9_COCH5|nr:uncharacterized protein COCC4DRAFT_65715 [Bipolaris maydis ATCC 48331]EMD85332.1 hypothetical protein COCHEDRAFT_1148941 [Bipolaris maydis C5]KAH7549074.1 hypothetical protein BM1_10459 [Bipolaris maydis]ENI00167.1 hypothetical protein COCC4DRAFT_65715 [Bipolaris maydis ATCC 48331]KAJ5024562.1 hypothetical protein J3E73DRAFT_236879 [Bipolaris maydis]KAJ5057970.1 hypothetical protein J3E74DRAFT_250877 [Bipolaris maydis]